MHVLLVVTSVVILILLIFIARKKILKYDNTLKNELAIPIIQLPASTELDENSLCEITDSTVISRITTAVPSIAETAIRTAKSEALKNMEVYKVILPSGASNTALTKSKNMIGAVRGYAHGVQGVKEQANLLKQNLANATALSDSVASVMNVGSLVVGQYYMTEINNKLDVMNESIAKIGDFQDKEFKSRILSLITRVGVISQFSVEILESNEQRKIKLVNLDDMNGSATELLSQVNETISSITKNTPKPEYKVYQEKIEELTTLIGYQNVLIAVLEEIGNLTYILGKNNISSDLCYSLYNTFCKQSSYTRALLEEWHMKQIEILSIDLENNRKAKSGIDGLLSTIPALYDDKYKYTKLEQGLAEKINSQAHSKLKASEMPNNIYDDVQIIIKDGKYYYMHDSTTYD